MIKRYSLGKGMKFTQNSDKQGFYWGEIRKKQAVSTSLSKHDRLTL